MQGEGSGLLSFVVLCQKGVRERGLSPGGRAWRRPWLGNWASPTTGSHPRPAPSPPPRTPTKSVIRLPSEMGWGVGACGRRKLQVLKSKAEKQITAPKPCLATLQEYEPRGALAPLTLLAGRQHLTHPTFQGGPVLFQLPGVHPHANFHGSNQL